MDRAIVYLQTALKAPTKKLKDEWIREALKLCKRSAKAEQASSHFHDTTAQAPYAKTGE